MPVSGNHRDALKNGLIIGFTQAVVFIVLLLILTFALGNQQQVATQYQRAIACELAVPVTNTGRDPAAVEKCFTDAGVLPPVLDKTP
jgi:hypothetical protein